MTVWRGCVVVVVGVYGFTVVVTVSRGWVVLVTVSIGVVVVVTVVWVVVSIPVRSQRSTVWLALALLTRRQLIGAPGAIVVTDSPRRVSCCTTGGPEGTSSETAVAGLASRSSWVTVGVPATSTGVDV